jgi:hypothetical protein
VLYVEGGTDVDMLRAFARKLKHPVAILLDDGSKLNVYYLEDNFPEEERTPEAELQRVEGGYGLSAQAHFGALARMLPELRGLAIQDNDGKGRKDGDAGGLKKRVWKRYEAENYFISPELLLARVKLDRLEGDLFHGVPETVLQEMLLELVFDGNQQDLENYNKADSSTRKTLWRAQTQNRKLSMFAEEFFRRLAAKTATPMLCRKGGLHELVALCDANDLNGEVKEKLDDLMSLLQPPAA